MDHGEFRLANRAERGCLLWVRNPRRQQLDPGPGIPYRWLRPQLQGLRTSVLSQFS